MDIPTAGPPIPYKPYPIPLKYQNFIDKEIKLLGNVGCFPKSLRPWATPVIIIPKKPDPLNPQQQQLSLVFDNQSLNRSINAVHNDNSVISYYPLPNITDLLAILQRCTKFFSLHLRSGYHHIGLTPETMPKTAFATTSGKWHCNVAPFSICSLSCVVCYFMSQVLSGLDFYFAYLDDVLVYSMSWKKHLQHLEMVLKHLKEANLKFKLSKCQFFKKHLHCLGHLVS